MAGSAPTIGEVHTMLQNAVHLLETQREGASVNAANWLDQRDTLTQSLETPFAGQIEGALDAIQGGLSSVLSPETARSVLDPIMRTYGQVIGEADEDPEQLAKVHIPRYFVDNSITIESLGVSLGTPTADGGNTGGAEIYMLGKDADDLVPEYGWAEAYRAEVIRDATGGTRRNRESIRYKGADKWATSRSAPAPA